jgi:hypothetical protein
MQFRNRLVYPTRSGCNTVTFQSRRTFFIKMPKTPGNFYFTCKEKFSSSKTHQKSILQKKKLFLSAFLMSLTKDSEKKVFSSKIGWKINLKNTVKNIETPAS